MGHRETAYDYECGCYRERTDMGTAYSHADRYTDPNELGKFRGWSSPSWIDSSHTAVFDPAALGAASGSPNVAFHELGHADAGAEDDLGHVYGLLDDEDAPSIQFGAMTRAGDKFAGAEDVPALRLRFYALPGLPRPGMANYDAQYRCQLEDPPGGHFDALSWAPDGSALAYAAGGDIYVVTVGDLRGGCTVGTPAKLVSGATSPSWGPAAAGPGATPAPGARLRLRRRGARRRRAPCRRPPRRPAAPRGGLRHGLRVRVTRPPQDASGSPSPAAGARCATAGAASRGAGSRVVTVRFARSARRSLRHAHTLSATLSVQWSSGGSTAAAKLHVTVPK